MYHKTIIMEKPSGKGFKFKPIVGEDTQGGKDAKAKTVVTRSAISKQKTAANVRGTSARKTTARSISRGRTASLVRPNSVLGQRKHVNTGKVDRAKRLDVGVKLLSLEKRHAPLQVFWSSYSGFTKWSSDDKLDILTMSTPDRPSDIFKLMNTWHNEFLMRFYENGVADAEFYTDQTNRLMALSWFGPGFNSAEEVERVNTLRGYANTVIRTRVWDNLSVFAISEDMKAAIEALPSRFGGGLDYINYCTMAFLGGMLNTLLIYAYGMDKDKWPSAFGRLNKLGPMFYLFGGVSEYYFTEWTNIEVSAYVGWFDMMYTMVNTALVVFGRHDFFGRFPLFRPLGNFQLFEPAVMDAYSFDYATKSLYISMVAQILLAYAGYTISDSKDATSLGALQVWGTWLTAYTMPTLEAKIDDRLVLLIDPPVHSNSIVAKRLYQAYKLNPVRGYMVETTKGIYASLPNINTTYDVSFRVSSKRRSMITEWIYQYSDSDKFTPFTDTDRIWIGLFDDAGNDAKSMLVREAMYHAIVRLATNTFKLLAFHILRAGLGVANDMLLPFRAVPFEARMQALGYICWRGVHITSLIDFIYLFGVAALNRLGKGFWGKVGDWSANEVETKLMEFAKKNQLRIIPIDEYPGRTAIRHADKTDFQLWDPPTMVMKGILAQVGQYDQTRTTPIYTPSASVILKYAIQSGEVLAPLDGDGIPMTAAYGIRATVDETEDRESVDTVTALQMLVDAVPEERGKVEPEQEVDHRINEPVGDQFQLPPVDDIQDTGLTPMDEEEIPVAPPGNVGMLDDGLAEKARLKANALSFPVDTRPYREVLIEELDLLADQGDGDDEDGGDPGRPLYQVEHERLTGSVGTIKFPSPGPAPVSAPAPILSVGRPVPAINVEQHAMNSLVGERYGYKLPRSNSIRFEHAAEDDPYGNNNFMSPGVVLPPSVGLARFGEPVRATISRGPPVNYNQPQRNMSENKQDREMDYEPVAGQVVRDPSRNTYHYVINDETVQPGKREQGAGWQGVDYNTMGVPGLGPFPYNRIIAADDMKQTILDRYQHIKPAIPVGKLSSQFSDVVKKVETIVDNGLFKGKEDQLNYRADIAYRLHKMLIDDFKSNQTSMTRVVEFTDKQSGVKIFAPTTNDVAPATIIGMNLRFNGVPTVTRAITLYLIAPIPAGPFADAVKTFPRTNADTAQDKTKDVTTKTHYAIPVIQFGKQGKRLYNFQLTPYYGYSDSLYNGLQPMTGERLYSVANAGDAYKPDTVPGGSLLPGMVMGERTSDVNAFYNKLSIQLVRPGGADMGLGAASRVVAHMGLAVNDLAIARQRLLDLVPPNVMHGSTITTAYTDFMDKTSSKSFAAAILPTIVDDYTIPTHYLELTADRRLKATKTEDIPRYSMSQEALKMHNTQVLTEYNNTLTSVFRGFITGLRSLHGFAVELNSLLPDYFKNDETAKLKYKEIAGYLDSFKSRGFGDYTVTINGADAFNGVKTLLSTVQDNQVGFDSDAKFIKFADSKLNIRPFKLSPNSILDTTMPIFLDPQYAKQHCMTRLGLAWSTASLQGVPATVPGAYYYLDTSGVGNRERLTMTMHVNYFGSHKLGVQYLYAFQWLRGFNYTKKQEMEKLNGKRVDNYLTADSDALKKLVSTLGGRYDDRDKTK